MGQNKNQEKKGGQDFHQYRNLGMFISIKGRIAARRKLIGCAMATLPYETVGDGRIP